MRAWVIVLALAGCHAAPVAEPGPVAAHWRGPAFLAPVPADTPYVIAALEPGTDLMTAWVQGRIHDEVVKALDELGPAADDADIARWVGAGRELLALLDAKQPLGFDPGGRFVMYGFSIFPVLRVVVADPVRVRGVVARVARAGNLALPERRTPDGQAYWAWPVDRYTLVAALVHSDRGDEAVVALLPTATLAQSMPRVLGTALPAASLRDARALPDLMTRHHLLGAMVGLADGRRFIDLLSARGHGTGDELLDFPAPISPACQADADRLIALMPRLAFGYHRVDSHGFDGAMLAEVPAAVIERLGRLRRPSPSLPLEGHPLGALAAAIDVDGLLAWWAEIAQTLHDRPLSCPGLAKINQLAAVNPKLPQLATGLRAFELVVDDASLSPPGGRGHVVVIGDHVADLVHGLLQVLPAFASARIAFDGLPVELPVAQLHVAGITSAHVAVRGDRAVLAVGDGSYARAAARLAAPLVKGPLAVFLLDSRRVRERFAAVMKPKDLEDFSRFDDVVMKLVTTDAALELDVSGTWNR